MSFVPALLVVAVIASPAGASPPAREDPPPAAAATLPAGPPAEEEDLVQFAADELVYDERANKVIATGNVLLRRRTEVLTADSVVWDRTEGTVLAEGEVRIGSDRGQVLVADRMMLSDDLKDGAIENLLLVLQDGGRLAANRATRTDSVSQLDRAIYSPCAVLDDAGCPQTPLWAVSAVRVRHDPVERRVYYRKARLEAYGAPILVLPAFSHPDSSLRNQSGLLGPDLRLTRELGVELAIPYYWSISPNQDLTTTTHIYSKELPLVELEYRHLTEAGPARFTLRGTYSEKITTDDDFEIVRTGEKGFRGMIEGNGRLDHGTQDLRSSFALRLTNDPNFPGRYQFTFDNRFRSTYLLERQRDNLWFGARTWYFQYLAPDTDSSLVPTALPLIDVMWRPDARPLGGRVMVEANALSLFRSDGQDMTRMLANARWDRSHVTSMGQRITLTGLLRSDFYHVRGSDFADQAFYAGEDGVQGRFIPAAALDLEWPLIGPLAKGVQTLVPRVMLVASTNGSNVGIPNEDSRALELEDGNLFALSRFPGYDRWEGGARVVYGFSWDWTRPGIALSADLGQSYRFVDDAQFVPEGTGLEDPLSDIVGRISLRAGRLASFTQRFRLDKDSLAVRRSDMDLSLGSGRTFASIGYLRYNRDVRLEDLPDTEEVRFGSQIALFRYWAVFGAMTIDLTSASEDPFTNNDGFQPIRSRAGFVYQDECFDFRFTWRRNYVNNLNAPEGNAFSFTLRLKNLGQ
jgi:LPS-assembly protein